MACRHGAGHRLFCVSAAGAAGCAAVRIVSGGAVFSRFRALVPRRADISRPAAIAHGRDAVARAIHHGFAAAPLFPDVMVWHARIETVSPLVPCRRAVAIRRRHACVCGNGCGGAGHSRVRSLVRATVARRRIHAFCLRGSGHGVSPFPDGVAGIDRARNVEFAGSLHVHRRVLDGAMESRRVGIFCKACYEPLARHGRVRALFAAFIVSGIWHWLLAYVLLGRWGISVVWGAFFFVQPLLILLERRMKVRRWRPAAARGWTLSALAVTCPLIVEPTLQIISRILGTCRPGAVDGGDGRARGGCNGFSSGGFVDGLFSVHPRP